MADFDTLYSKMNAAAEAGDWDTAISHAHSLPANWDGFQKLPQHGIPEKHADKILDILSNEHSPHHSNLNSFLIEHAQNLKPNISTKHLNRLAHLGREDMLVTEGIHEHPNWRPDEETEGRMKAAKFWTDYESHVKPSHFAAVGSLFSGKSEFLQDHRGQSGTSEEYKDAIPHLKQHAQTVQKEVMKDNFLPKKWFNGQPHVRLWRGVGGNYGQMIREHANYDPKTNEIDHKRISVPTAAFSSWTAEPELARNFAHTRDEIVDQPKKQGVVMSRWVPVKDILHTGFHRVVTGQDHPHFNEYEVVVGHPKGAITMSTKGMEFVKPEHGYGETEPSKIRNPKIQKGITELLVAGSLMLPTTFAVHPMESAKQSQTQQSSPFASKGKHSMDRFLNSIGHLESSSGKNTAHKPSFGFHGGSVAIGEHAIMPLTAQYVAHKTKNIYIKPLAEKSIYDISQKLQKHPDLTNEVAREYASHLNRRFKGNKQMMAHAWRRGPNKVVSLAEAKADPYVQAFTAHYEKNNPKPTVKGIHRKLQHLKTLVKSPK